MFLTTFETKFKFYQVMVCCFNEMFLWYMIGSMIASQLPSGQHSFQLAVKIKVWSSLNFNFEPKVLFPRFCFNSGHDFGQKITPKSYFRRWTFRSRNDETKLEWNILRKAHLYPIPVFNDIFLLCFKNINSSHMPHMV